LTAQMYPSDFQDEIDLRGGEMHDYTLYIPALQRFARSALSSMRGFLQIKSKQETEQGSNRPIHLAVYKSDRIGAFSLHSKLDNGMCVGLSLGLIQSISVFSGRAMVDDFYKLHIDATESHISIESFKDFFGVCILYFIVQHEIAHIKYSHFEKIQRNAELRHGAEVHADLEAVFSIFELAGWLQRVTNNAPTYHPPISIKVHTDTDLMFLFYSFVCLCALATSRPNTFTLKLQRGPNGTHPSDLNRAIFILRVIEADVIAQLFSDFSNEKSNEVFQKLLKLVIDPEHNDDCISNEVANELFNSLKESDLQSELDSFRLLCNELESQGYDMS